MSDQPDYVMGHEERERQRLKLQAAVLEPVTEQLFRRAGLSPGMNVLDYGCGMGDVSMLAARLVGSRGRVVGLDMDETTLATARARAKAQGLDNVTFVKTNVAEYRHDRPVDAITCRHIVIHVADPLGLFRSMFSALRPGGLAVVQEYDFSVFSPGYPATPLRDSLMEFFKDLFLLSPRGNMGAQLYHLAVQAGFEVADCRAEFSIDGGEDSLFFEWVAESVKTILPRALEAGVPSAAAIRLDGLADRLRQESVAHRASFPAPMMIGCIARKP